MIRLVRLFTGPDGQSHVEDGEVPLAAQDAVNAVAPSAVATAIYFEETAAGASLDWHNDPHRRYVITLTGTVNSRPASGRTSRSRQATSCWPRTRRAAAIVGAFSGTSPGAASTSTFRPTAEPALVPAALPADQ